ncbi:MAG: DNA-protecting protein DprA, partial [Pseudomonadota bacterium]
FSRGPRAPPFRRTNRLIRDGAHLVEDIEDVLAVLGALPAHDGAGLVNPNAKPVLEAPSPRPSVTGSLDLGEPPDTARTRLLTLLGPSPTQVDTLLRESGLEPGTFRTLLLELELAGRIERQPGNKVARLG